MLLPPQLYYYQKCGLLDLLTMKYILLQSGLVPLKMVENGAATSVNKEVCICIMYVCLYACIYMYVCTYFWLFTHAWHILCSRRLFLCMYVCMQLAIISEEKKKQEELNNKLREESFAVVLSTNASWLVSHNYLQYECMYVCM